MKKTNENYSISATIRKMKVGQVFTLPFDVNPTIAHVSARQLGAAVSVRKGENGYDVFLQSAVPAKAEKICYPIRSGKAPETKQGRPSFASLAAAKGKAKAKASKPAKVSKPAAKAKASKASKAKVAAPKARGTILIGGKRVPAPLPPFAKGK